jgi:membrane protein DedA with SNARE-associated domain
MLAGEMHVERELLGYLAQYGTPVVFVAQLLGIFGLPIPDELLLTMAGVLIRRGELSPAATLAAAIGGCMAGITISYVLGRTVGYAAVRRITHGHEEIWARAQRWFRRFGGWLLTFGFFIPGVRHVTAIAAGTAPMDYPTFSAWTYPGAALWATTFVALGYYAGDRWREMAGDVHAHAAVIVAAVLVVAAVGLWIKSRVESRESGVRSR